MATYEEIYGLWQNSALQNKVRVACIIAAETIMIDPSPPTNQTAREAWAAAVFENPNAEATRMLRAVLAANADATAGNILGALDSTIQSNVDAHVDLFAGS
jgi:hypothetical protein